MKLHRCLIGIISLSLSQCLATETSEEYSKVRNRALTTLLDLLLAINSYGLTTFRARELNARAGHNDFFS